VTSYLKTLPGLGTQRYLMVDTTGKIKLVRAWDTTLQSGPGDVSYINSSGNKVTVQQTCYTGIYRRWDPMNAKLYKETDAAVYGKGDESNVIWCPGWTLLQASTLGRPNTYYYKNMYKSVNATTANRGPSGWYRGLERNFKVVDGDLPSIGWLGELMLQNRAIDGPLTRIHADGQKPFDRTTTIRRDQRSVVANQLDTKVKFDIMRPFHPSGEYDPEISDSSKVNTKLLHVLDMFTVWDPSRDGFDNDGDGAVDEEDTGLQAGDKGGPEVRVFGRIDLNTAPFQVLGAPWPDNPTTRTATSGWTKADFPRSQYVGGRQSERLPLYEDAIGPFESIGDMIRADGLTMNPGTCLVGSLYGGDKSDTGKIFEYGITTYPSYGTVQDEDADGIGDERDERDMIFTWTSNFYTTRDNVFMLDADVRICEPPYYPKVNNEPKKLPFPAYKTSRVYTRKQFLGILDRSTCLRLKSKGGNDNEYWCDFTGPVEVRMMRSSDDIRTPY
jgi:hypothetical protein